MKNKGKKGKYTAYITALYRKQDAKTTCMRILILRNNVKSMKRDFKVSTYIAAK